jgi:hypothetical protein
MVDIKNLEETSALPVTINKYALEPNNVVLVPRGKVVLTAFAGKIAYAWVMHHPEAPVDAQILTVPSHTVISLETDPLFFPPEHVGSFFMADPSKLLPSAWHCFLFMPRANGSILLAN